MKDLHNPRYDDFGPNEFTPIPKSDYQRLTPPEKRAYKLTRHYHIRSLRRAGDFWSKPPLFSDDSESSVIFE